MHKKNEISRTRRGGTERGEEEVGYGEPASKEERKSVRKWVERNSPGERGKRRVGRRG